MRRFKYRLVKFAGEWHLYDKHIQTNWETLLFSNENLQIVVKYMDADAADDRSLCNFLRFSSARLCKGF